MIHAQNAFVKTMEVIGEDPDCFDCFIGRDGIPVIVTIHGDEYNLADIVHDVSDGTFEKIEHYNHYDGKM